MPKEEKTWFLQLFYNIVVMNYIKSQTEREWEKRRGSQVGGSRSQVGDYEAKLEVPWAKLEVPWAKLEALGAKMEAPGGSNLIWEILKSR